MVVQVVAVQELPQQVKVVVLFMVEAEEVQEETTVLESQYNQKQEEHLVHIYLVVEVLPV